MAEPVQQPPQPSGGKRKGKAQYVQAKRARRCDAGGPRQLEPGLQGILITCNMNERKCVEEAYSLLNEYGDDMYGPEKVPVSCWRAGLPASGRGDVGRSAAFVRVRATCRVHWAAGARPRLGPALSPLPGPAPSPLLCSLSSCDFLSIFNYSTSHLLSASCRPKDVLYTTAL